MADADRSNSAPDDDGDKEGKGGRSDGAKDDGSKRGPFEDEDLDAVVEELNASKEGLSDGDARERWSETVRTRSRRRRPVRC